MNIYVNARSLRQVFSLQFSGLYVKLSFFYLEVGTSDAILCVLRTHVVMWFLVNLFF